MRWVLPGSLLHIQVLDFETDDYGLGSNLEPPGKHTKCSAQCHTAFILTLGFNLDNDYTASLSMVPFHTQDFMVIVSELLNF